MKNKLQQEIENLEKGCGSFDDFHSCICKKGYLCRECLRELSQTKKCIEIFKEMLEHELKIQNKNEVYDFDGIRDIVRELKSQLEGEK